ncbi:MAG TPA: hypothetical protein VGK67_31910 [Myxococcales bacterium]|jgi:hypothetical protein
MSEPIDADSFEFLPPAAYVAQAEQRLRPMMTRMLPRTAALSVGLVLLARAWMQRTWDVTIALGPTLLLTAAIVLPLLLVTPLLGIVVARRARFRVDARGLHTLSLPGFTDTIPWRRVMAVSLVERRGFLTLEATLRVALGIPETRRFPFDPDRVSRGDLIYALGRFAPATLVPGATPRGPALPGPRSP